MESKSEKVTKQGKQTDSNSTDKVDAKSGNTSNAKSGKPDKPSLTIDLEAKHAESASEKGSATEIKESSKSRSAVKTKKSPADTLESKLSESDSIKSADLSNKVNERSKGMLSNAIAGAIGGLIVFLATSIFSFFGIWTENPTVSESRIELIEDANQRDNVRLEALEDQTGQIDSRLKEFLDESNENSEFFKLKVALAQVQARLEGFDGQIESVLADLASLGSTLGSIGDGSSGLDLTEIRDQLKLDMARLESVEDLAQDQKESIEQLVIQGREFSAQLSQVLNQLEEFENVAGKFPDSEGRIDEISNRMTQIEGTVINGSPRELASRAIAVVALKNAIDSGKPYSIELAAVQNIAPEIGNLTKLTEQSNQGVPTVSELIGMFPELAQKMKKVKLQTDEESGFIDAMISGVLSLVVIRDSEISESSDPQSLIYAMEQSVSDAELERAMSIHELLPDNVKQPASEWVDSVKVRLEVDTMVETVSKELIQSLAESQNQIRE